MKSLRTVFCGITNLLQGFVCYSPPSSREGRGNLVIFWAGVRTLWSVDHDVLHRAAELLQNAKPSKITTRLLCPPPVRRSQWQKSAWRRANRRVQTLHGTYFKAKRGSRSSRSPSACLLWFFLSAAPSEGDPDHGCTHMNLAWLLSPSIHQLLLLLLHPCPFNSVHFEAFFKISAWAGSGSQLGVKYTLILHKHTREKTL